MNNILDEHSQVWKEHSQVFSHIIKIRLQEEKGYHTYLINGETGEKGS